MAGPTRTDQAEISQLAELAARIRRIQAYPAQQREVDIVKPAEAQSEDSDLCPQKDLGRG